MKLNFLTFIFIILASITLQATHNRAGEIRYQQINELSIKVELITYTKSSSVSADRDTINLMWGDGTISSVPRQNGKGTNLPNDIKMNIYEMTHTYPGRGEYIISMLDPNRVENILNVDPPNSVNIPFYIQTKIKLFNTNFQGINHSPTLTNPPIDFACLNQLFVHNPGAIDLDDDSISYELIVPLMDVGTEVPNYSFPSQIRPGFNNTISLDPITGNFTWKSPQLAGEYNIAIAIHEFRKGQLISTTIRDMQIFVRADCLNNNPPTISRRRDTCLIAGSSLDVNFNINDLDGNIKGGRVKVQALGAPFIIDPIAVTNSSGIFNLPPYQLNIKWNTACSHVRNDYYSIIIKATDDYFDTSGLSNIFIYRVKIIGPAPENLTSSSDNKSILLEWNFPYQCDTSQSNFQGFSVWRKEVSTNISDSCITGLDKYGYTQIEYLTKNINQGKYYYNDTNIVRNKNYCYRIQAEFALRSSANFLYNFTSSLPSNEICNSIKTNEPFILNVDVKATSEFNGQIFLKYHKPIIPLFDTLAIIPPYKIKIYSTINSANPVELQSFTRNYNSFSSIFDTIFLHTQLNTEKFKYGYHIELSSANSILLNSQSADQIFLNTSNIRKAVQLNWTSNVPWLNYKFKIFRKSTNLSQFDSIGITSKLTFNDNTVIQDSNYCYFIQSEGQYSDVNIERPLINNSNISCITAFDSTAPCCPILNVLGPCELGDTNKFILLKWVYNEDSCNSNDIESFYIEEINGDAIKIIATGLPRNLREYQFEADNLINSCYTVHAMNSKLIACSSNISCINQCPEYELPNTFTPNADGFNDLFKPIRNRQISRINLKIINGWGNEVYQTSDPEINWDGRSRNGKMLNDGTYYYSCEIYNKGNSLINSFNGFIEILKGR
ncbi:MAG: gliding motility-associated C-terminal domain-containing protein [Saprospiraceae bacterium]